MNEKREEVKRFLTAAEVADYLGVSVSKGYKIISQLNAELREQGFITVSGKVSRKYFEKRIYSEEA